MVSTIFPRTLFNFYQLGRSNTTSFEVFFFNETTLFPELKSLLSDRVTIFITILIAVNT